MKKIFFFLVCIVNMQLLAQEEKLRVTLNVGNPIEFNINQIKDITFFEETAPLNLVGEWFCYNEENDIYESFELYEDGTLFYHCYNLLENETAKGRWAFRDGMLGLNYITTVPLKWTNRSLKLLNYSLLRAILRVNGFEFVPLQPNLTGYNEQRSIRFLSTGQSFGQKPLQLSCSQV